RVGGVAEVHDVARLHLQVEVLGAPPVVVAFPDHPVVVVRLVDVGAGDDGVTVGVVGHLGLVEVGPQVVGNDAVSVEPVHPFLRTVLREGHGHRVFVGGFDAVDEVPQVAVGNRVELAEFEGGDHVVGDEEIGRASCRGGVGSAGG